MKPIFAVILHVPLEAVGDEVVSRRGSGYYYIGSAYPERLGPPTKAFFAKARAFEPGELLVLDPSSEREVGYPERKPSKWLRYPRDYVIVKSLSQAIDLAQKVLWDGEAIGNAR